jgi:hypothetical protein
MRDLRQKVLDDSNEVKRLAARIPGYGGYLQKEMRRDADKLLRNYLARQLREQRKRLGNVSAQLAGAGNLKAVGDLEQATMKLQTIIDKIKTASYGYAGLFDAVTVQEKALDALYNFDNNLLASVETIGQAITGLATALTAKEGLDTAIAGLQTALDQVAATWEERAEVILQT